VLELAFLDFETFPVVKASLFLYSHYFIYSAHAHLFILACLITDCVPCSQFKEYVGRWTAH